MEKITDLTAGTFDAAINNALPVLVDFWSPTCVPCRKLAPILAEIAAEYEGEFFIAKVNAAEHTQLAARYGVDMLPTLLFFFQGRVVNRMTGVQPKHKIQEALDEIE
ncbi:MAG: thioredoxin fold domain-containing protein [Planctomycetaceae bacterium]|jgi:thioredoxin 1|nr:thioredoxin fold domain-containing protein [Planctomycetaceae bacterium]